MSSEFYIKIKDTVPQLDFGKNQSRALVGCQLKSNMIKTFKNLEDSLNAWYQAKKTSAAMRKDFFLMIFYKFSKLM